MNLGKVGGIIAVANHEAAKPLLQVGAIPIIRRIVITYQQVGVFPIVVVVGGDDEELKRELSADARHIGQRVIKVLEEVMSCAVSLRQVIEIRRTGLKTAAAEAGSKLENLFYFCTEAFGEGQEMQILVTELTISTWGSKFISRYGCKSYYAHNQGLLLDDRTRDLLAQIDELTMPLN